MGFWSKAKGFVTGGSSEGDTPAKPSNAGEEQAGDSLYSSSTGRFDPLLYDHMGTGIDSSEHAPGVPQAGTDTDDDPAHVGDALKKDVNQYSDDIRKWNEQDERL
jgi:hypothetical protein